MATSEGNEGLDLLLCSFWFTAGPFALTLWRFDLFRN